MVALLPAIPLPTAPLPTAPLPTAPLPTISLPSAPLPTRHALRAPHARARARCRRWLLILSVLWRAATKPALLPLVPLAFRSVQLIASDFLAYLPPACLPAYIEVAAAFATQTQTLNVALTAIGLQWTIGDYLFAARAKRATCDDEPADDGDDGDDGAKSAAAYAEEARAALGVGNGAGAGEMTGADSGAAAEADGSADDAGSSEGGSAAASGPRYGRLEVGAAVRTNDVWCAIMQQLRRLCIDPRPEVRMGSMHSLNSIISSHGSQLTGRAWDRMMHGTLQPLFETITLKTLSASTDAPVAQKLGTEGGRDVLMMLHHSRDTEAKQWYETWGLALDSAARIYRGFLPQLVQRPSFDAAWEGLLAWLQTSILSLPRSWEVAVAAITATLTLLVSSARASIVARRPPPPGAAAITADAATANATDADSVDGNVPTTIPIALPLSPGRDDGSAPHPSPRRADSAGPVRSSSCACAPCM